MAKGDGGGISLDLGGGSSFRLVNNRVEIRKMEMAALAELVTRFVDRPVIDATGLTGRYDMTLPVAPEDYNAMMMRAAIGSGVQLPPQALQALNAASGNPLKAPMERLGLTFDARTAPLDFLVIDSMSKTPTAN